MAKDGVVYHIWCISISESIIDSIDKFVVCTLLSLLIKQNVSVSVNVSFYKVYRGLTVTS